MGEYSDRVRADIVSDNRARRILYLVYGAIAVAAVCLLGGFATIVLVLGLGPVLALIVVIEIYSRIQDWRRVRAAEEADADIAKLRPEKSTEACPSTSFVNCGVGRNKRKAPVNRTSLPTCGSPPRR